MASDQPTSLRAPHAPRERGETVPGAHLAIAVAKVAEQSAMVDDGYPRHVPEDLRAARGILLVGPLIGFAVWLVLVIICVVLA